MTEARHLDRLSALAQRSRDVQKIQDLALESMTDRPIEPGDVIVLPVLEGLPVEGLVIDEDSSGGLRVLLADQNPALGPKDRSVLLEGHQSLVARGTHEARLEASALSPEQRSGRVEIQSLNLLKQDLLGGNGVANVDSYGGNSAYREWRQEVLDPALALLARKTHQLSASPVTRDEVGELPELGPSVEQPQVSVAESTAAAPLEGPWRRSARIRRYAVAAGWVIALVLGAFLSRLLPSTTEPAGSANPTLVWVGIESSVRSTTEPLEVEAGDQPLLLLFEIARPFPHYSLKITKHDSGELIFSASQLRASGAAELAVIVPRASMLAGSYQVTVEGGGTGDSEILLQAQLRVSEQN